MLEIGAQVRAVAVLLIHDLEPALEMRRALGLHAGACAGIQKEISRKQAPCAVAANYRNEFMN